MAACCVILFDYIFPLIVSRVVRYMISHRFFVQQIYQLGKNGLLSSALSIIESISILFCVFLFLYIFGNKRGFSQKLKKRKIIDLRRLFLCGIWGLGAAEFIIFGLTMMPAEVLFSYENAMGSIADKTIKFLLLFSAANMILVPITEEVVFREVLYRILRNSWGRIPCILLISCFFAGVHGNLVQMGYAFAMGVILCVIRENYGSVLYTELFHIVFNLFGSGVFFSKWAKHLMYAGMTVFVICTGCFVIDVKNYSIKKIKGKG